MSVIEVCSIESVVPSLSPPADYRHQPAPSRTADQTVPGAPVPRGQRFPQAKSSATRSISRPRIAPSGTSRRSTACGRSRSRWCSSSTPATDGCRVATSASRCSSRCRGSSSPPRAGGARPAGRIDAGAFYARRVRRLLPASLVCLLGVMVAAWAGQFHGVTNLRRDLWAALAQVYNWVALAGRDGYAAADGARGGPAGAARPLLEPRHRGAVLLGVAARVDRRVEVVGAAAASSPWPR